MTTSPSQVSLYNRYEGLQVEPNNDEDDGPSMLVLSRLSWPMHHIQTTHIKKKKKVGYCHSRLSFVGNERFYVFLCPSSCRE